LKAKQDGSDQADDGPGKIAECIAQSLNAVSGDAGRGNTYVTVIEFGRELQTRSLLVFGERADPTSPHFMDQARLYARGEMKPSWFALPEIKRHSAVISPGCAAPNN
jgi:acyl-homoserine lactone acylase PvdQ